MVDQVLESDKSLKVSDLLGFCDVASRDILTNMKETDLTARIRMLEDQFVNVAEQIKAVVVEDFK